MVVRDTMLSSKNERVRELLAGKRRRYLSFARALTRDAGRAEEALQEATVRALERSGQIEDIERVEAWFYRILRNVVQDGFRRSAVEERRTVELPEGLAVLQSPEGETCACAMHELEKLKPEYSDALRAVDMQESAVQDFARKSEISPTNALVRLHRARRALRHRIEKVCGSCAGAGCFACTCGQLSKP